MVSNNAVVAYTPKESCGTFVATDRYDRDIGAIGYCGALAGGGQAGITTVIYTYTTDGAVIVVETTMAAGGGPFTLDVSGIGSRLEGGVVRMFFWIFAAAATITGTGMIVL